MTRVNSATLLKILVIVIVLFVGVIGIQPTVIQAASSENLVNSKSTRGMPNASATCEAGPAQWSQGADLPIPLVRAVGVWYPPDGHFYVLGGRTADPAGSDSLNVYAYDPSSNNWSQKAATFNNNQVNNMAAGLLQVGGEWLIYMVGGSAAGAATSTAEVRVYNPVADTITVVATDPWPAPTNTLPGGWAVFNNKLYILGGFLINVSMTQQIWQFDPNAADTSRWTLKAAVLPTALGYIPTASVGNYIYTAGGSDYTGGVISDTAASYKYDPVNDTITTITSIPRATGETRALNVHGQMWVLGGGRSTPNPSTEVDIYDPATNAWSLGLPFSIARRNFPADNDPVSGEIYLAGGYSEPTTATNNMQIFEPARLCVYQPIMMHSTP